MFKIPGSEWIIKIFVYYISKKCTRMVTKTTITVNRTYNINNGLVNYSQTYAQKCWLSVNNKICTVFHIYKNVAKKCPKMI